MGRSVSLVFLRDDDEDRIGLELAQLLHAEDYGSGSKRLEVGYLTTGAASWSLLKAEPPDLLQHPAPGSNRPRLAELARRLGCDAFHFELHENESISILEASAEGAFLASGPDLEQESFGLISVPENVRYIVDADEDVESVPERIARALGIEQVAVDDETADTIVVWYTPSRPQPPAESAQERSGATPRKGQTRTAKVRGKGRSR